jgi:carbonic anhydrase/acetyltransferase-like protein (isoleucine patch superfamily)
VVLGQVATVNGRVELTRTVVDRDVSTVNGDVRLGDRSVIRGSIVIKGRRGIFSGGRLLEIRIEDGSTVEGGIDVHDANRRVRVYIGKDSAVKGQIRNAKVVKE